MTTMPIDNHPLTRRRLQFQGIRLNIFPFAPIITKIFKEAVISLRHLSILEGDLYLGPLEIILRIIKRQIVQT